MPGTLANSLLLVAQGLTGVQLCVLSSTCQLAGLPLLKAFKSKFCGGSSAQSPKWCFAAPVDAALSKEGTSMDATIVASSTACL